MKEIVERKVEFGTPWFELRAKRVAGENAPYYSLRMSDYVSVVALTTQQELLLVKQYRPAIERLTLELPSGHVEPNETPANSARRELAEECGFDAPYFEHLGTLLSDTGRNENRLWGYLALDARPITGGFVQEPGVERIILPCSQLQNLLRLGEFDHALHVAVLMLAVNRHGSQLLALKQPSRPAKVPNL
jgi:ADP-ribose pyrophosphatase